MSGVLWVLCDSTVGADYVTCHLWNLNRAGSWELHLSFRELTLLSYQLPRNTLCLSMNCSAADPLIQHPTLIPP